MFGTATPVRLVGQLAQHGRVADHPVLALLGHEHGVRGIDECR